MTATSSCVVDMLTAHAIDAWVAGDDSLHVDGLVAELDEIGGKRFPHKRAFVLDGVMVELFLVQRDADGLFTTFWGTRRNWPPDTLRDRGEPPIASVASVRGYRASHPVHSAA
jgi:hypothetical protein